MKFKIKMILVTISMLISNILFNSMFLALFLLELPFFIFNKKLLLKVLKILEKQL